MGDSKFTCRGKLKDSDDNRPSILVVEDDIDTRLLIARLLENRGFDITIAEDGVHGALYVNESSFDLILADINMPNLDGLELMDLINRKGIKTPVVFLTARADVEDEKRAMGLGAVDYLRKPVTKDALVSSINKAISSKRRMSGCSDYGKHKEAFIDTIGLAP